ncbi:CxC2 domain-containing protein [Favolaschia claudopus]|uniref:CxC2 domain-containing protein n=1 Tax=Favolaschia claudopus TaxID=2862362 RepID=A0AAV9YY29_9AGAR
MSDARPPVKRRVATSKRPLLRGGQRSTEEYLVNSSVAEFITPPINAPIQATVERPTADRRRVQTEVVSIDPPSPVKRARIQAAEPPLEPPSLHDFDPDFEPQGINGELYDMDLGGFFLRPPSPTRARQKKAFKPSDPALYDLRRLRDEYLREFLRLDGCGDAPEDLCPRCDIRTPVYRCRDCHDNNLYCKECCLALHAANPLHIVDAWDGQLFTRTSLKTLGLRIQFGHPGCGRPRAGHESFVVVDVDYIHEVAVDFCGCEREIESGEDRIQLLRYRWFPATHQVPRTAFTFRLLDNFHIQTLKGKTTMYDYYSAVEKLTDGTGGPLPYRYREFLRVTRMFRHLLMLKRGGRGHALSGVNGTQAGELAIRCPACPRPGINLPENWEAIVPELRYLYTFFLALDACFRLKRRLVSSALRDPALGAGWSYFCEPEPYRQYLLTVTNQTEMSTCSGLAALDYANTKFSRGYSVTGVGMGVCARHEFVQPTGVGDLQKGERYANMDWITACILRFIHARLPKVISYDIVCQWFKNLLERLKDLPPLVRLTLILHIVAFVIPKMHIHAHTLKCQLCFSLNYLAGAGQTDGEGIERPWANIGGVASSTREMGPGSRADVLDDHWAFWNWCKLITLGELLRKRLDKATRERDIQKEAFDAFTAEQGERVVGWEKMVVEYEADTSNAKNPYEVTTSALKESDVRLKLAEEEAADAAKGVPSLHDVSPSSFVHNGLELEDQQRRLRVQIELKKAGTTTQQIDIIALRRTLSRGIVRFRKLQATYSPGALQALARRGGEAEELPETTPLMLPSALTPEEREVGCVAGVQHIEQLLRHAQCSESLMRLRNQLHIKSRYFDYKALHARHQGANTRTRSLVARNESKIRLHSEKYQAAWDALRLLAGGDVSTVGWRRLRKEDVRTMEDPEELTKRQALRARQDATRQERIRRLQEEGEDVRMHEEEAQGEEEEAVANPAENRREVSWIWTEAGTTGTDAELEDALRIEWTKARARSRRWTEEVGLLKEEHRRALISFEHEAVKWENRVKDIPVGGVEVGFAQGAIAYALGQAAMYRKLAARLDVSMTEIHRGRGRKRMPAMPAAADEEEAAGSDDDDDEDDDEAAGGVASDEEFFMGGEVEE